MPALPETRDIAPAQRFDVAALAAFLAGSVDGFQGLEDVRQFKGGASNPTFFIIEKGGDGRLFVMRKKPPGQLLASAHQVDREYRVMRALSGTDVPVPRMRALCTDESVIGTAFYVMDYLEGRIFRDARLPELSPAERTAVYDEANATLAKLHHVDHEKIGLGDFGRPGNYFERQIGRWSKQYRGAETESHSRHGKADRSAAAPHPRRPVDLHCAWRLSHREFMFHPTEPKLIAVLDWELSTIGHPLADIAYNGLLWHSMSEAWGNLDGVDFATSGIPTETDYVADYCRRTGRASIPHWNFYLAFSLFRLASIRRASIKRILDGIASTDRAAFNDTPRRAEQAWELLNA